MEGKSAHTGLRRQNAQNIEDNARWKESHLPSLQERVKVLEDSIGANVRLEPQIVDTPKFKRLFTRDQRALSSHLAYQELKSEVLIAFISIVVIVVQLVVSAIEEDDTLNSATYMIALSAITFKCIELILRTILMFIMVYNTNRMHYMLNVCKFIVDYHIIGMIVVCTKILSIISSTLSILKPMDDIVNEASETDDPKRSKLLKLVTVWVHMRRAVQVVVLIWTIVSTLISLHGVTPAYNLIKKLFLNLFTYFKKTE